jgi:CRISPR-associated protein Cas1
LTAKALLNESETEPNEWAERCGYWLKALEAGKPKRKRREKESFPLVLNGNGLSIAVDKGTLIVKGGFTHYPQEKQEQQFFKGELTIPPRIVIVDGSGSITLDALDWMMEQNVDLIRLGFDGRIITMAGASGYAADRQKVTWQIATRANEVKRVAFAIPLIKGKIKETLWNLDNLLPDSPSRDKAIETAKAALKTIRTNPPETVSELLGLEGMVAQGYFYSWRSLNMKWKAAKRYPIPEEWKQFFARSSILSDERRPSNRWATHPINAMLNYAYTALESRTRIQAIADGYDPSIGIMHDRIKPERHSFVFDMMEPQRPVVDRSILKLVHEHSFSGADFMLQKDGVVRVNPELVGMVLR